MADKLPYFPFFPDDWLSDEKLRLCSLAARGLWMDLLCLMHKGDRRGFLQQANGTPFTPEQIARVCGCSPVEAAHLLQELLTAGAASADERGVAYSRRMARDERKRKLCSEAGKRGGGNPVLTFKQIPKGTPKGTPKGHSGSGNESVLSSSGKGGAGGRGPPPGFAEFWAVWPRREAKQAAVKAWRNLAPGPELVSVMLAAVDRQKQSEQWQRGYIPHPATWINGRRWEDELHPLNVAPQPARRQETTAERYARVRAEQEARCNGQTMTHGPSTTPPSAPSGGSPT